MIPAPDLKRTVMMRPAYDSVQIPVAAESGSAHLPTARTQTEQAQLSDDVTQCTGARTLGQELARACE
jgi:hypothetical protein